MEIEILRSLFFAFVAVAVYALLGYFKRADPKESFKPWKFVATLLIAVVAWTISYVFKITPEESVTLVLAEVGLVVYIEFVAKAIYRRLKDFFG